MLDRDEEMCSIYNSSAISYFNNRYAKNSDASSDYEEEKTKIYNPSTLEKNGCTLKHRRGERGMIVQVPTEVIPVWFIEKWGKENAESGSALDYFLKTMIKDWRVEEIRQKAEVTE